MIFTESETFLGESSSERNNKYSRFPKAKGITDYLFKISFFSLKEVKRERKSSSSISN